MRVNDVFFASFIEQFSRLPLTVHLQIGLVLLAYFVAAPRLGMWGFSIFAMPGTIAHELSHWIVALLLGARPSFPNLIPEKSAHGWTLGSVSSSPNFITRIPIALAPFSLLPIGIWYAIAFLGEMSDWGYLHLWVAGTLIAASLPSRQDWKVALPSIALLGFVYWLLFYRFNT